MPLDSSTNEFRNAAHRLVDWVADFFDHIDDREVLSRLQPGDVEKQFAAAASESGKPYDELIGEFEEKILPGITHWNHPAFMGYFANTGSQAGVLGELLTAALNVNGMVWKTSPALTELETLTLRWLRDALGLRDDLFGIINDTASVNVFLALAAARESLGLEIRREGMAGRDLPPLRVYISDHTHSCAEKGALALGLGKRNVVKIPTDELHRMRVDALEEALMRDRAAGMIPMAIVATVGTTSSAAVDPIRRIGEIAQREKIWYHVDAAYAGPAMICPELREAWDGIELADSLVVNPHKWLFTPMDCSVLYTRHPNVLRTAFTLFEVPPYLELRDTAEVNYMDYGIQLGRRFRALKLWMIMEHYGLDKLRTVIREHIGYARRLADELARRDDIELLAPPSFSLVVFRKKSGDDDTQALLDRINASGKLFLSSTRLRGHLGIRLAIGNGATEWRHVERVLGFV